MQASLNVMTDFKIQFKNASCNEVIWTAVTSSNVLLKDLPEIKRQYAGKELYVINYLKNKWLACVRNHLYAEEAITYTWTTPRNMRGLLIK